jgi:uncharacterized protein YecA (UPF0149 family)
MVSPYCGREQRFGSDSKEYMPAAYVRGSTNTAPQEAADIVAKGANHGVLAHQGTPAEAEAAQDAVKQKLLQLHAFNKALQSHKASVHQAKAAHMSAKKAPL